MNATPPEASIEYSKGPEAPGGVSRGIPLGLMCGALLGALMLVVAEFTTLYNVHAEGVAHVVGSQATGSHNTYALVPIAVAAVLLGVGVWRGHSRPALLAVGLLGVIALLIAILGDLPDAHVSGLVVRPGTAGAYLNATTKPSAGFYLETLGGAILLITSVGGFVLVGPPARRRPVAD